MKTSALLKIKGIFYCQHRANSKYTNRLNTKELAGLILETYKNNGFYQAERNSNGNYDIVRKRLSGKILPKYKQYIDSLR